ncbi:MAG: ATP-binding cassette domain-containing protein [Pseudomonadota bacterium]
MIRVEGLSFAYRNGPPVLDSVDFTLGADDIMVVAGASGSGKSTLARLLVGLLHPGRGQVTIDGTPVCLDAGTPGRAQLVFQDAVDAFDPRWSLRRSLLETGADAATIAEAIAQVGLDEALLERRPGEVSGGQRQRVGIARALSTRPELIVADEPLAQLDPVSALAVVDALLVARARAGCALIVFSHRDLWTGRLEAQHATMADGRLTLA